MRAEGREQEGGRVEKGVRRREALGGCFAERRKRGEPRAALREQVQSLPYVFFAAAEIRAEPYVNFVRQSIISIASP